MIYKVGYYVRVQGIFKYLNIEDIFKINHFLNTYYLFFYKDSFVLEYNNATSAKYTYIYDYTYIDKFSNTSNEANTISISVSK